MAVYFRAMEKVNYVTYAPEGAGEDEEPRADDPRNSGYLVQQKQCRMCLQYFYQGEELMKIPICDHVFHAHCLRKWLVEWQKCPSCDRNIIHVPSEHRGKYLKDQAPEAVSSDQQDVIIAN